MPSARDAFCSLEDLELLQAPWVPLDPSSTAASPSPRHPTDLPDEAIMAAMLHSPLAFEDSVCHSANPAYDPNTCPGVLPAEAVEDAKKYGALMKRSIANANYLLRVHMEPVHVLPVSQASDALASARSWKSSFRSKSDAEDVVSVSTFPTVK